MTTLQIIEICVVIAGYLLAFALVPRVVLARRESAATLSWILFLLLLPFLGAFLYWIFGERRLRRFVRNRRTSADALDRAGRPEAQMDPGDDLLVREQDRELSSIVTRLCGSAPTGGNAIAQFADPDAATERMLQIIDAAKSTIHFEVYQFKSDESGVIFRDHLVAAARRGVKVRLLFDDLGTLWTPKRFFSVLREAGADVAVFLPVSPMRGLYQANLRNHRKILIVDGVAGFTGGLNVGDEYGGPRKRKFGPWRDTHLEIRGPGVAALQEVFVEDWFFVTGEEIPAQLAFPPLKRQGNETVHVVPSGPDSDWESIHHAIFTMITLAERHVYLTTPYFIPDRSMLVALQTAALRGVDVRLLLPERSDHAIVCAAGRYHYPELLQAGVRIFQYTQGMLHSKTVEVDGRWSTIGSANLDLRSFRLNFEMNIVVYGMESAGVLESTFINDLTKAREITSNDVARWTVGMRLRTNSARLLEGIL